MDVALDLKDLKNIIRRRKTIFIVTFITLLPIFCFIAFILPPIYKSQATIIIEGQEVPDDIARTMITTFAEERLEKSTRKVMRRDNLIEIIKHYNLYPNLLRRDMIEPAIRKLKKAIIIETVRTSGFDRGTGGKATSVVAFNISYESTSPSRAQNVTNALAYLYIELEKKGRERITTSTATFFEEELGNLKTEIQTLENRISNFKADHPGELPEYHVMNIRAFERWESDLERLNIRYRALEERKMFLTGQMAIIDPLKPIKTDEGTMAMNPKERLQRLRLNLLTLQSSLSEKHPDIKKLKREIAELEAQIGDTNDAVIKIKQLSQLENDLVAMKSNLGPKHPDVIKIANEVELLSREVDALLSEEAITKVEEFKPDNPTYINLSIQMVNTEAEMNGIKKDRKRVIKKIEEYRNKVEAYPVIEKKYKELTRDYESAKRKYDDLSNKRLEAKISQGIEESQRGERFIMTEPAFFPSEPYKPNRLLIVLLGFILSTGLGILFIAAQEGFDNSVKTSNDIKNITASPVLSMISYVTSNQERKRKRRKNSLYVLGIICVTLFIVFIVDSYLMPISAMWILIKERVIYSWHNILSTFE